MNHSRAGAGGIIYLLHKLLEGNGKAVCSLVYSSWKFGELLIHQSCLRHDRIKCIFCGKLTFQHALAKLTYRDTQSRRHLAS